MNDIISLIKSELDELIKNEEALSKKRSQVKKARDIINPHKGKFIINNVLLFLTQEDVLKNCLEVVFIDEKFNFDVAINVILGLKKYYEYQEEIRKINRNFMRDDSTNLLDSEFVKMAILRSKNESLKQEYLNMLNRQKKMDEAYEMEVKSLYFMCSKIIFDYEYLSNKRSELKDKIKLYKSIIKKIQEEKPLSPREISAIITLINVKMIDDSKALIKALNEYLSGFVKQEKVLAVEEPKPVSNSSPVYVDEDKKEEKKSPVYENYLKVIKTFNSFNDVGIFLDSLKYGEDILHVIEKIINLLSDSKEDLLLKSYLENYAIVISSGNKKDDVNNALLEENIKNSVLIMYYDFYEGKNRILSDIEKLSSEYYDDVLKAIEQIRRNGGYGKRKRLDCVKKAFRIRVNDIRVTYRQISENTYVILGVFCKKDHKGYDVINVSAKRNNDFNLKEPFIEELFKVPGGKQRIEKKNEEFENAILTTLNSKVNIKRGLW